jgi:hypothetical protein
LESSFEVKQPRKVLQQQHGLSLNHIVSNNGHGLNHSGSNHHFVSHIESMLSHGGSNCDGLNHL